MQLSGSESECAAHGEAPGRDGSLRLTIVALNASSALAQLAQFGMLYPLLALWLGRAGMPTWQVGLVGSAVWGGLLGGNLVSPWLLTRVPALWVAAAGCTLTALLALAAPSLPPGTLAVWLVVAVLLGACIGVRWIGIESWLYTIVPAAGRGRLVGVHETLIQVAQAAGPALIAWAGLQTGAGFYLAAAFSAATLASLAFARVPAPRRSPVRSAQPAGLRQGLARRVLGSPGLQIGLVAGLIDGVLFGMLPSYLVGRAVKAEQAALLLTLFGIGGLVSQVPLGWAADRHGLRVATGAAAVTGLLGAAALLPDTWAAMAMATALLGAVAASGLTLSTIARAGEADAGGTDMATAIAEVSLVFTAGSLFGPALAGGAMQSGGGGAFIALGALGCAALLALAMRPRRVQPAVAPAGRLEGGVRSPARPAAPGCAPSRSR